MASYSDKHHERAFRLWFRLGSYRAVAAQKGMPPSHSTIMRWAGDYDCPDHCPWHNWVHLKAAYALRSAEIGETIRLAPKRDALPPNGPSPEAGTRVLPGGRCQEVPDGTHHVHRASGERTTASGAAGRGAEFGLPLNSSEADGGAKRAALRQDGPPCVPQSGEVAALRTVPGEESAARQVALVDPEGNAIEGLRALVRSRAERLKIIRDIEGLAIERLRELQKLQEGEGQAGEQVSMREVGAVMGLIFRAWDEERLELGNPTQIIEGSVRTQHAVDVQRLLRELDVETRHAFIAAYRRQLARTTDVGE